MRKEVDTVHNAGGALQPQSVAPLIMASAAAGKKDVPIVFCADANYGLYLPVVVQSIIDNSSADYHYHIIVFDCGIAKEAVDALARQIRSLPNFSLHVKNIESWLAQHEGAFEEKWHLTRAMYGRLFITELCNGYEKVIYADIDVVFNRDVAELISIDLDDNYIAGAIDVVSEVERIFKKTHGDYMRNTMGLCAAESYINSGILVFNIRAWLNLNLSDRAIHLLRTKKLLFPDQDAINHVCQGKIAFLGQDWNCLPKKYFDKWGSSINEIPCKGLFETLKEWDQAHISYETSFHFIGPGKPWVDIHADKGDIWWLYAAKTPLYAHYIRDLVINSTRDIMASKDFEASVKTYKFLNIPYWTVKETAKQKKYFLGRNLRIAKKKKGKRSNYIYIFGVKLFSSNLK